MCANLGVSHPCQNFRKRGCFVSFSIFRHSPPSNQKCGDVIHHHLFLGEDLFQKQKHARDKGLSLPPPQAVARYWSTMHTYFYRINLYWVHRLFVYEQGPTHKQLPSLLLLLRWKAARTDKGLQLMTQSNLVVDVGLNRISSFWSRFEKSTFYNPVKF